MKKRISLLFVFILSMAFSAVAQEVATGSFFGDSEQPGNRLHKAISAKMEQGESSLAAIQEAIETSLSDEDNTLDGESKAAVAFDIDMANQFYVEMLSSNSLIEVTKVLIESNADKAIHAITLGTVLYPDFAQEVYDGAVLTGLISPEDALVAVIQAGADPTTVSDATAAGTAAGPAIAVPPLGAGIGAGGTGGGDTTASTN